MKRNEYYFDYTDEALQNILKSNILRNRDKKILLKLVEGKTVSKIAEESNCSYRTICNRRRDIFNATKKFMNYKHRQNKRNNKNNDGFKVYILTFPNNKVYIGITSQKEAKRWNDGKNYISNKTMYNDIIKYGWNNIKKDIVYRFLTEKEALEKEKELIIHYKSHLNKYGYNKKF